MAYKLRFVQKFQQSKTEEFMQLEKMFMELEQKVEGFPKGKRYVSYMGGLPVSTLIWECEFPTLEELIMAKKLIENDNVHDDLFEKQVQYIIESYVEIYKEIDLTPNK